jgi:preprotein translocase subunit SecG
MGILIGLYVVICIALIGIILVQRGRGGGFVDAFQGMESVFGTKTTAFLTRATSVLAVLFFVTVLTIQLLSLSRSKSLIRNAPVPPPVRNATGQQVPGQDNQQAQQPAQPQTAGQAGQTNSSQQAAAPAGQNATQ